VLSDIHVAPAGRAPSAWHNRLHYETALDRLDAGVRLAEAHAAAALLLAGDLADDGGDESLDRLLRLASTATMPVWAAPGNHDAYQATDALTRAVRRAGSAVRVVSPTWEGLGEGIFVAGPRLAPTAEWGVFAVEPPMPSPADAELAVWLTHYPVLAHAERFAEHDLKFAEDAQGRGAVEQELRALARPLLVISGHLHARDTVADGPILEITASPSIEAPFEMTLVEVRADDGVAATIDRVGLGFADPEAARPPILAPEHEAWRFADRWRRAG